MSDDTISRKATIDAMENVDWYHINKDGQLTHGANSKEDEPLYKAKDVYTVLNTMPSAQPKKRTEERTETHACDLISRQAAIDAILAVTGNSSVRELYEHVQEHELSDMWSGGVNAAIDVIIAVPSVQTESKETSSTHKALDTISRQAAIRIVDGIDTWQAGWRGDAIESMKALPSAQPETHEERTETHACDLISRQAAIDALDRRFDDVPMELTVEILQLRIDLRERIPSVQPEQTNSWCINSWCVDCKEYDTENKCCPRYSRVIKQTLDDAYRHGETEAEARFYDEIVRCKDCRYRDPEDNKCDCGHDIIWQLPRDDKWYCADAERRTDGN